MAKTQWVQRVFQCFFCWGTVLCEYRDRPSLVFPRRCAFCNRMGVFPRLNVTEYIEDVEYAANEDDD